MRYTRGAVFRVFVNVCCMCVSVWFFFRGKHSKIPPSPSTKNASILYAKDVAAEMLSGLSRGALVIEAIVYVSLCAGRQRGE